MDERIGPPDDDPGFLAWRAFLQAQASVISLLERELEDACGMTMSQYEVLLYLRYAPEGRMRMQDLAASVLLSKSGVTRLVDRMVASGDVERIACESDRRVTWAAITDQGRGTLRAAAPIHVRGIREHFTDHLTEDEAMVIADLLRRVFLRAAETSGLHPNALEGPLPRSTTAG